MHNALAQRTTYLQHAHGLAKDSAICGSLRTIERNQGAKEIPGADEQYIDSLPPPESFALLFSLVARVAGLEAQIYGTSARAELKVFIWPLRTEQARC